MSDHYSTLGVARSASAEDIKRAYRKLAMKHHPDRGGNEAEFKKIEEAYRVLSDPQQRQEYDNPQVRVNVNGNPFHGGGPAFDFDTIFEMFGARMHPGARQHHQQQQRVQRISIWISMADAVQGGNRPVSVATLTGTNTIELRIPPGIQDNENVRYPGLAPGGMDLIVNWRVHPNPAWHREGLDLWCQRDVDFWNLITGATITVTDILGRELELTVPPRCKPGTVLRAKSRGIAREGHNTGDLMVRLNAVLPQDIPEEIIDILSKRSVNK